MLSELGNRRRQEVGDIARGDLGPSFQYPDFSVNELIAQGLPVSAGLGGLALLLALLLGVPMGVLAAAREGGRLDRGLMLLGAAAQALPKFVIAPLLILLFACGVVAQETPAPAPILNIEEEFTKAVFFGKKFADLGEYNSAQEQYSKADALKPDQPAVLYNLAVVLARAGRYSDAQVKVDRYLQLFPEGAERANVTKLQLELELVLGQGGLEPASVEHAISVFGSLAERLLIAGRRLGVRGPGLLILPDVGARQRRLVLSALARLQPGDPTPAGTVEAARVALLGPGAVPPADADLCLPVPTPEAA